MVYWIKKSARLICFFVFFIVLITGINPNDPFNVIHDTLALGKAILAAALFWFTGFILSDIVFKGLLEHIDMSEIHILEGGLMQQIRDEKAKPNIEFVGGGRDKPPKKSGKALLEKKATQ
ncbi:MAG: hypothetical protein PHC61_15055 [Chitinivibrionales bacterium]|nr:hypothetical protein [Chitinivibrionales bacterium]